MRFGLLCSVLGMVACGESTVKTVNATPEAYITSHATGDEVAEGSRATLRGQVADTDDALTELNATWTYNGDPVCPEAAPDTTGAVACELTFTTDGGAVSLQVRDPNGEMAIASVNLSVRPTDAPTATLTAPTADGTYYSDQSIAVQGTVADTEDPPEDLDVRIETDEQGDLGWAVTVTSEGAVEAFGTLDEGEHAVRLVVTDTTGKEGIDSVVITVGPPNAAPSCAITAPADSSAGPEGDEVRFEGTATDPDVPADRLSVTWESDKDGPIGTSTPDSDGSVGIAITALSVQTHRVQMTVSDEVGATCTDSIYYTVGTPPDLTVTAPTDGAVLNHGESVVFQATVADTEDLPNEVTLRWVSDRDGLFSEAGSDSSGAVTFATDALRAGSHIVTVTATDTHGLFVTDTVSFELNQAPVVDTVSIGPDPAYNDSTLVCTATATDDSGTEPSLSFAWTGGATGSALTLTPVIAAPGDTLACTATATDSAGLADAGTATVVIANRTPTVGAVAITPASPTPGDSLTCAAPDATDPDADALTRSYAWAVDGTGVGSDSATLVTALTSGETVTCTVTVADGTGASAEASAEVTVVNTRPEVTSAALTPTDLFTNDTVTALATASDSDGDPLTVTYAFRVNGIVVQDGISPTLDGATHFDKGDAVSVVVTADDGDRTGSAEAGPITVQNTPPTAPVVSITEAVCPEGWTAFTDGERCVAVFEGPDHTWTEAEAECVSMGGHLARIANADDNTTVLELGASIPDESIWIGYNERADEGTWVWSDGGAAEYENWRSDEPGGGFPTTDEDCVALLHSAAAGPVAGQWVDENCETAGWVGGYACQVEATADGLTCSVDVPSTDADGDAVLYGMEWDVDGVDFTGTATVTHDGDTVPSDAVAGDELWTCEVTPTDGSDPGITGSASLFVDAIDAPLDIPDPEMSFDVLAVSGTLRDHDVSADGSARLLSIDSGTIYLTCFTPDGTDTSGLLEVGEYETWLSDFGSSFAVYTSRVSKHSIVVWRWQTEAGSQELRYTYLDADCTVLNRSQTVWSGDYMEFLDAAIDDRGRAVIAYGQGATRTATVDSDGTLLRTETAFDIDATYGTHVAMNQSTGAGIVASQVHSGDGIYYQRFDADFNWIDASPVRMAAGYHYWYDGFTVGMNDHDEFAFLWVSGTSTINMAFYDADGSRVADVTRGMPSFGGYDVFRRRHAEIPLNGDNFIFGEVYTHTYGAGTTVRHFEYTPTGAFVSEGSTTHSLNEGLTIRTDGWGNATVRDASTVMALYSYP